MTAREAALHALALIRREGTWSNEAVERVLSAQPLDLRETALATRLCMGVTQNRVFLDACVARACTGKRSKLEPKISDILRLAAYQILFLDRIPVSAAVNEAVTMAKKTAGGRAAPLVNAVLHRIAENREALLASGEEKTAAALATRWSHPLWLTEHLISRLGWDETAAFLRCNNAVAPVFAQSNPLKGGFAAGQTHEWLPGCRVFETASDAALREALLAGTAYIQDPAAVCAVLAAEPKKGDMLLDCCAAPGGKSFAAALRMENQGKIVSCDIREGKLSKISDGMARLGITIGEVRQMDASAPDAAYREAFDVVLADVPCSGFGVIRKKPEIREKTFAEVEKLPELQKHILAAISGCCRVGGTLVYSTCTVLKRENEAVVRAFLEQNKNFEAVEFSLPCPQGQSENGMLTLWPQRQGTDGFFIAKLRRIAE